MSLTKVSYSMITGAPVNVLDFGAKGDGITDDTVAIQAAIVFCENNILPLYFPSNAVGQFYKTTAPLVVSKPLTMTGENSRNVTIVAVDLTVGQFLLDIDGTTFGTYEQGEFGGFTLLASAGNCMRVKNASVSKFSDIVLRDSVNGIIYTGTRCYSNTFERIIVTGGISGVSFQMSAHTGGGQHSFSDCSFGGSTGFSISNDTFVDSVNFYNTNFEQCLVNSFFAAGYVRGLGFYGCRTEGCDGIDFNIRPTTGNLISGIVFEGCSFVASDNGGVPRISFGGDVGLVRGFNVNSNSVGHGGNNFSSFLVQLNGDGESGTVANNFLDGTLANCAPVNTLRSNVAVYNNEANNGKFSPGFTLQTSTWTPIDASGAGLTLTTAYSTYSRVGNIVTASAEIVFPATANASNIAIGGLPFAIATNTIAVGATASTNGAQFTAYIKAATSNFVNFKNESNAFVPNSSISTGTITFTLTYFV